MRYAESFILASSSSLLFPPPSRDYYSLLRPRRIEEAAQLVRIYRRNGHLWGNLKAHRR
jgi:hypothetical protein